MYFVFQTFLYQISMHKIKKLGKFLVYFICLVSFLFSSVYFGDKHSLTTESCLLGERYIKRSFL